MDLEAYLEHDDRIVLPVGSTEQHAYLSLATDTILAERVAAEAAEPLGVAVLPAVPYGVTPWFVGFPGSASLSAATLTAVLSEIIHSVRGQGFGRVFVINGHGGNSAVAAAVEGEGVVWHDWFGGPRVNERIKGTGLPGGHASWTESFPWTRVDGVTLPEAAKEPLSVSRDSTPAEVRALIGDGSFGGSYVVDEAIVAAVWEDAVADARDVLSG